MSNSNTVPVDSLVVEVEPKQDGTPWISTTLDNEAYLFRQTGGGAEILGTNVVDTIVGGTVCWNQWHGTGNWANAPYPSGSTRTYDSSTETTTFTFTLNSNKYAYLQKSIAVYADHVYLCSAYVEVTSIDANHTVSDINSIWYKVAANASNLGGCGGYIGPGYYQTFYKTNAGSSSSFLMGFGGPEAGITATIKVSQPNVFDITEMFGPTIADAIVSMDEASWAANRIHSGVIWFRKYFPKMFYSYPYDPGTLLSVKTSAKVITGKNLLNEFDSNIVYSKYITGLQNDGNWYWMSASDSRSFAVACKPNTTYTISCFNSEATIFRAGYINDEPSSSTQQIYGVTRQGTSTPPIVVNTGPTAKYIIIQFGSNMVIAGECKAMMTLGSTAPTEYEAYSAQTYPLDSDLELRGPLALDANNNLVYNGDVYPPSGKVTRKFNILDLGSLTYSKSSLITNGFVATAGMPDDFPLAPSTTSMPNWVCTYAIYTNTGIEDASVDKAIAWRVSGQNKGVIIKDSSYSSYYTGNNMASFKTAMSGKYLVYEKTATATETADPFTAPQIAIAGGTEEYIDNRDTPLPVGHKTTYYEKAPITGTDTVDVEVTGPNLLGGTMLADAVVSSMPSATIDYDEKYVNFAASATTNHAISDGYIKFKENTRYTFIISLYKTRGTGSNLIIDYTDGTFTYVPGPSAAASKETVKITSDANKTISALRKCNSSGSTRIYYDESGIFEGVLDFDGFVPYSGQMLTADIATNLYSANVAQLASGTISPSTGKDASNSSRCRTNGYIPVSELTQYTLTYVGDFDNYIYFYDNTKTFIADSVLEWAAQPRTFTTPETAAYARFIWNITYANGPSDVQLDLGPSATPYRWNSSGYESTYDFISGDLIVKRNYVDLSDFKSSWSRRTTNIFSATLSNSAIYDATIPITDHLCDTFKTTYVGAATNAVNAKLSLYKTTNSTGENTIYLNMAFAGIDTVDELNEWLSIVHPCFCYKFYSPREYDLLEDPLSIYAPSDTKIVVSSVSGDVISATFSYDKQNYILHSITFYDGYRKLNTYANFHLIADPRPSVTPPSPKSKYLDVPGANGKLDLSTILTGFPVFDNREGDWTFYVLNGYGNWADRLSEIMNFLQGQQLKMVLEDDPNYYYRGRFYVSDWSSEPTWSKITIHYSVYPYKIGCAETAGPNNTIYLTDTGGTSL